MLRKFSPAKVDRSYCWENLSYQWFIVQRRMKVEVKEFSPAGEWPEVSTIFYDKEVYAGLSKLKRWQAFAKTNALRPQSVLEHSVGLVFLTDWLVDKMNGNLEGQINKELLRKAVILHDVPEGILQEDVSRLDKTSKQDAKEFSAFTDFIASKYDQANLEILEKVYLLQFCLGDISAFTKSKQELMRQLASDYYLEALMFRMVENLDYLLYAEEQWVRFGEASRDLIHEVATLVVPIIEALVSKVPSLDTFWTPKAHKHFSKFI